MAIRNDITIFWDQSPRIIQVDSPSADISMQDLYDTLRANEIIQMDEPSIVLGSGKEQLGGGVLVGLTLTLLNALLSFEARTGPGYTQCAIQGGNLVATDVNGDYFTTPVFPTAFTQVVLANSSSATLQELTLIQQASFEGVVTVDVQSGFPGTEFPLGTPRVPVDNLTDAYAIAEARGIGIFAVVGDLTIGNEADFENYVFIGSSASKTTISIQPIAQVTGCEFYDCHVDGTLDGNSQLERCVIDTLAYIEGFIFKSMINPGVISLANNNTKTAHFLSCYSGVPGAGTPIIDMAGDGAGLAIRDYNGGISLRNKTGSSSVSIDLNSGQAILQNTVTSGTIVARGIGKLIDENGNDIPSGTWNGATIINETINGSLNEQTIADAVWNKTLP